MIIKAGKTYRTRGGDTVKIVAVNEGANRCHYAIGWHNGGAQGWAKNGAYHEMSLSQLDLIEKIEP